MQIAVIGTGNVGAALGTGWARAGHHVTFGVREPGSPRVRQLLSQSGGHSKAASLADSVSSSEVVALAIPWAAVQEVLQEISRSLRKNPH